MSIKGSCVLSSSLCFSVLVSGLILSSSYSFATDSIEDDVSISVPIACSLTSTLDSDHIGTIYNGTNTENIGTTTMQVFCNDAEGFAIYAAGYTNNEIGTETSTKLIGMNNQTPVGNISTGIATSGNTSNWSMKVTKAENEQGEDPVAYNPNNLTIESDTNGSFANYHVVPSEYTKVASFSSSTDVTLGSLLQTTYQAYISPTQPAGTYTGQVKYVLVHPSTGEAPVNDNQIGVIFHSTEGSTFPGGLTKNRVVYGSNYISDSTYDETNDIYVGNEPTIIKTSNLDDDGTQLNNQSYTDEEYIIRTLNFPDASGVKVVVDYGITADTAEFIAIGEAWDGDWNNWNNEWDGENGENWLFPYDYINDEPINKTGIRTYMIDGNTVTIYADTWNTPESGYDYGFYVEVYPIYATEHFIREPIDVVSGAYAETTNWNYSWYIGDINNRTYFTNEDEVIEYLKQNQDTLEGTIVHIYAGSYPIMQDIGQWKDSLALEQQIQAMDIRDGKVYYVAKLKDGNVWMTQNLDLDIDSNRTYTHEDTDLGWGVDYSSIYATIDGDYNFSDVNYTWTPSQSTYSTGDNTWNNYYTPPESYDPGELYWNEELSYDDWSNYYDSCVWDSTLLYESCDETLNPSNYNYLNYVSNTGNPHYHLGNYYNWSATVASNDFRYGEWVPTDQSICPAGWTLPQTGYNNTSIKNLINQYDTIDENDYPSTLVNGTELWASPMFFSSVGNYYAGTISNFGFSGMMYSTGIGYDGYNYMTTFDLSGAIQVDDYIGSGSGLTVRCVSRSSNQNYYYTIKYDANGGVGSMDDQTVWLVSGEILGVRLRENTFTKTGYALKSWNTKPDGSGQSFINREKVNGNILSDGGTVTLYAQWQEAPFLQDVASWENTLLPNIGDSTWAIDQRDNYLYTVARLADGNVWMTQNLKLDLSYYGNNINSLNTNNPTSSFVLEANSNPSPSSYYNTNGWYNSDIFTMQKIGFNNENIGNATIDVDGHLYDEYGVYYDWYAATAGNGTRNAIGPGESVIGDICPKGWHISKGDSSGEFSALLNAYSSSDSTSQELSASFRSSPSNFTYSGYYYVPSNVGIYISSRGDMGSYWTSTRISNSNCNPNYCYFYVLSLDQNNAIIRSSSPYNGNVIRCVHNTE